MHNTKLKSLSGNVLKAKALKEKIYFYPQYEYTIANSPNPYIVDFQKALSVNYIVVNKKSNHKGVLDFFKYIFKTDIFIFNWIEDLPIHKYGKLQVVFFILFLSISKLANKKIIWILHNKYSHFSSKNYWTDFMYFILMKYSNLIFTHSKEGISFGKERYSRYSPKIKFFNHPVRQLLIKPKKHKEYDFLIWGTIKPYKGVLEFLKFLKENEKSSFKILIAGKCFDDNYKNQMELFLSTNITFKNEMFTIEEISEMASQCKFILFLQNSVSVLSSGVLMDSIGMGVKIIGPNRGAFRDLSALSFINVYNSYEDIFLLLEKLVNEDSSVNITELNEFYKKNTWLNFGNSVHAEIIKMNNSNKS